MTQGELIDRMCGDLYKLATDAKTAAKYTLSRFAIPWGRRNSETFLQNSVAFGNALIQFAKDSGIRYYADSFWYFNGKIYQKVTAESVDTAYDMLMMKLGISVVVAGDTYKRKYFINIIKSYNPLNVRNDIVAFSNRVVDLRKPLDGAYRYMWSPKWHVIDYHPYPYNPEARCPRFMRFLNEVLPEKKSRDILQMFLGLGLIQSSEAFDKTKGGPRGTVEMCLILLGSGANGKSVLFNIICALFGKNHISSVDYDTMTADGDEGLRGRATIRSAIFNWSSDSDPRKFGKKNNAVFKQICSGEPYQYRLLGKDIMYAERCPYLIFSFNELPTLAEATGGFTRRLQFVNFDVTIPKYKQNPNLAKEIIDSDLPGIFNWVARGAKEIKRRNFQFPTSDESLKNKVRALLPTNPVFAWKMCYSLRGEPLAPGEISTEIRADLLYDCFVKFCENNDVENIWSKNKFGFTMSKLNFAKERRKDGISYVCYGATEEQLIQPMIVDMLKDYGGDAYTSDDKDSYIKED